MNSAIGGGLVGFGFPFLSNTTIGLVLGPSPDTFAFGCALATIGGVAFGIGSGGSCWMNNEAEQKILTAIKDAIIRHDSNEETDRGIVRHVLSRETIQKMLSQLATITKNNEKKNWGRCKTILELTDEYRIELYRILQSFDPSHPLIVVF